MWCERQYIDIYRHSKLHFIEFILFCLCFTICNLKQIFIYMYTYVRTKHTHTHIYVYFHYLCMYMNIYTFIGFTTETKIQEFTSSHFNYHNTITYISQCLKNLFLILLFNFYLFFAKFLKNFFTELFTELPFDESWKLNRWSVWQILVLVIIIIKSVK